MKRIAVRGANGEYMAPQELEDVPGWVQEAYEFGWLVMSAEDDFSSVWVAVPGEDILGVQMAVRARGDDVLINHGDWIGVLKECQWEMWT